MGAINVIDSTASVITTGLILRKLYTGNHSVLDNEPTLPFGGFDAFNNKLKPHEKVNEFYLNRDNGVSGDDEVNKHANDAYDSVYATTNANNTVGDQSIGDETLPFSGLCIFIDESDDELKIIKNANNAYDSVNATTAAAIPANVISISIPNIQCNPSFNLNACTTSEESSPAFQLRISPTHLFYFIILYLMILYYHIQPLNQHNTNYSTPSILFRIRGFVPILLVLATTIIICCILWLCWTIDQFNLMIIISHLHTQHIITSTITRICRCFIIKFYYIELLVHMIVMNNIRTSAGDELYCEYTGVTLMLLSVSSATAMLMSTTAATHGFDAISHDIYTTTYLYRFYHSITCTLLQGALLYSAMYCISLGAILISTAAATRVFTETLLCTLISFVPFITFGQLSTLPTDTSILATLLATLDDTLPSAPSAPFISFLLGDISILMFTLSAVILADSLYICRCYYNAMYIISITKCNFFISMYTMCTICTVCILTTHTALTVPYTLISFLPCTLLSAYFTLNGSSAALIPSTPAAPPFISSSCGLSVLYYFIPTYFGLAGALSDATSMLSITLPAATLIHGFGAAVAVYRAHRFNVTTYFICLSFISAAAILMVSAPSAAILATLSNGFCLLPSGLFGSAALFSFAPIVPCLIPSTYRLSGAYYYMKHIWIIWCYFNMMCTIYIITNMFIITITRWITRCFVFNGTYFGPSAVIFIITIHMTIVFIINWCLLYTITTRCFYELLPTLGASFRSFSNDLAGHIFGYCGDGIIICESKGWVGCGFTVVGSVGCYLYFILHMHIDYIGCIVDTAVNICSLPMDASSFVQMRGGGQFRWGKDNWEKSFGEVIWF